MTFGTPIPLATLAWVAAAAAALTITAYILKIRRRRFEVPFSMLWQRVLEQRDASALWKQLRRLLSLLLLLLMLALLLVAALDPTRGGMHEDARSVVILIDTSASMKTTDGDPAGGAVPRLEVAKRKARALIDGMGGSDVAMIMRVDGQTTPLSRFDSDGPMLRRVVDGLTASDTPADLHRALGAAADALRDRQNPLIVVISDGAYSDAQLAAVTWEPPAAVGADADAGAAAPAPADEVEARRQAYQGRSLAAVDLSGIDVRYLPVGHRHDNVGIIAFNVRRYVANKAAYEVFIEVQNFGPAPARRQLALYSGESALDVQPIELAPGEKIRRIYPDLSGGADHRLRASLRPVEGEGGSDPFSLDDHAYALLPERKRQKVLLVTEDNLYLEGAMLVYDNIEVFKVTPDEYDADQADLLEGMQVVVFDGHTPAEPPPPPLHAIYFHPSGTGSPVPIARSLPRPPRITEIAESHPVMRWVSLSDVNFDATQVFAPRRDRGEAALAWSVRDPVIAARRDEGRKLLAFGFSLRGTDLPLRVAFPLLLVNALDWFAGDDADLVTTYVTGQRLRVPLDGVVGAREAEVLGPDGQRTRAPVVDGMAAFYGARVGFHEITVRDAGGEVIAAREIATNLANPAESDIAPAATLRLGGRELAAPAAFHVTVQRRFWTLLLALLLVLLAIEWVTYHRRITV
jgi:Ca-activated chloride channel homolog